MNSLLAHYNSKQEKWQFIAMRCNLKTARYRASHFALFNNYETHYAPVYKFHNSATFAYHNAPALQISTHSDSSS